MAKILVVEDDINLAKAVKQALEQESYRVDVVHDGELAAYHLRSYGYELIILDLDIPKISGAEVARKFRVKHRDTPIIMLTDKGTLPDKSWGFLPGTDEHLAKPFEIDEMTSRVKAVLNRAMSMNGQILSAGDVELEPARGRVYKAAIEIKLSAEEFALLEFLLRNRGKVFSTKALLNSCWTASSEVTGDAVRTCIEGLRERVDTSGAPSLIRSIPGSGFTID